MSNVFCICVPACACFGLHNCCLALRKGSQSQSFVCTVDFKFGGGRGSFTKSKGPSVPRMEFL